MTITLDHPPTSPDRVPDVVDRLIHGTVLGPLMLECIVDGTGQVQSNLLETADEFILQLSLAGLDENAVQIVAQGRQVTVTGRFRIPYSEGAWVWQSIRTGEFCDVFRLPRPVEAGPTTATLDGGILTITLLKAQPFRFEPDNCG